MSTTTNLFGWDQPMRPTKSKRGQPKGNAAASRAGFEMLLKLSRN